MNLTNLADLLSAHIDPDGGIWFSRLDNPATLHLPDGGVRVADGMAFITEFLGVAGIGDLAGKNPDDADKTSAGGAGSLLDKVYLTRLEVEIGEDLASSSLFVGVELHDTHWPLGGLVGLGDDIAIENPGVSLGRVAGEEAWEIDVHGVLSLWDAEFAISASWPEKAFSASCQGKGLSLDAAAGAGGLPKGLIKGTVAEASISARVKDDQYSGALTITGFGTGQLTLDRCRLQVDRIAGDTSASVVSDIHVTDGLDLQLSARYEDGGIVLKGENLPGRDADFRLGPVAQGLVGGAVDLPAFITDLRLVRIEGSYDSSSGAKHFLCEAALGAPTEGDDDRVRLGVDISTGGEDGNTHKAFLKVGPNHFKLVDRKPAKDPDDKHPVDIMVATYIADPPREFSLKDDLVAHATQRKDVLELLPDIGITVSSVAYARLTPEIKGEDKASVFSIDLGATASVNIAALPLIGDAISALGAGNDVGVGKLQVTMATAEISRCHAGQLNEVLEGKITIPLPADDGGDGDDAEGQGAGIAKGFTLSGEIDLGPAGALALQAGGGGGKDKPEPVANEAEPGKGAAKEHDAPRGDLEISGADVPSDDAHWFSIEKKLGPLFVHKLGFSYREQELWVIPQADFTLSGLTISLSGFAVSTPLDHFSLSFHLQGLGVDFKKGPMEIGGALLRTKGELKHEDGTSEAYEEYCGTLVIKTDVISLAAIGAYTRLQDGPSMFVYLDLKYPIGGPPFFFVTGLSGGFGYNRALNIPRIKELADFPFVKMAMDNRAPPTGETKSADGPAGQTVKEMQSSLSETLGGLQAYVPPEIGQQWFAAGVHFTSFKIVDGFALLTLAFGHRFELHLLGKASFSYPPKADASEPGHPMTRVDVLVDAAYLPDQGIIQMNAMIADGSYVFEEACHLTGGLAFKTWFKGPNKDEFVFTLGGYHPKFKVPADYPTVDRLGFNWQKGDALSIKGGMYFAMTGHALMAGGFLDATYESGCLKAWLKITADFLIYYKPFRYDASMSVDVGAEVTIHFFGTHHLSVNLGADLHIWGPEFSGTASFDIWIASFSVSFGAGAPVPPPIPWAEFRHSFLPPEGDGMAGVVAVDGLIKELKGVHMPGFDVLKSKQADDTHWMIDPKHLTLQVNFVAPTGEGTYAPTPQGNPGGIASMGLTVEQFKPRHDIQVLYGDGDAAIDVTHDAFRATWIPGRAPAGLWGEPGAPGPKGDVNAPAAVDGTASAVQLRPKHPPTHGDPVPVEKKTLAFATEEMHGAFAWQEAPTQQTDWRALGTDWSDGMDASAFDARGPVPGAILDHFLTAGQRDVIEKAKVKHLNATDLLVRDPEHEVEHG